MHSSDASTPRGDIFATTHWTVVLAAGGKHTPLAEAALEELCRTYWYPLYAYIRRRGESRENAEDLTQAFFARFLQRNHLEHLNAGNGRFRAFLLASVKHFLANEWDRSRRLKRGHGAPHLSLDWHSADTRFQIVDNAGSTPDKVFDREWSVALLGKVIERLRKECADEGRARQFEQLKVFLTSGKGAMPHAEAASALDMGEGAVRAAVHRLRKRYRQLLRHEIAQTLADPAQVDEEMRSLFGAFAP